MARRCGLGTTHFIHLTKRLYNMTPAHYLSHCRLIHAEKMLRERSARSVAEVAMACGCSSSQYFATLFRNRYGCTPTEFKGRRVASEG